MHNRFLFHVRDRDDVKLERRCNHRDQCNHRNETAHASMRSGLATRLLLGLRCGEVAVDHLTVLLQRRCGACGARLLMRLDGSYDMD